MTGYNRVYGAYLAAAGGQRDSAESEGSGGGRCAPQEATPESGIGA